MSGRNRSGTMVPPANTLRRKRGPTSINLPQALSKAPPRRVNIFSKPIAAKRNQILADSNFNYQKPKKTKQQKFEENINKEVGQKLKFTKFVSGIIANTTKININWGEAQDVFRDRSTTLLRRNSLFVIPNPNFLYQLNLKTNYSTRFPIYTNWTLNRLFCFEVIYNYKKTHPKKLACVVENLECYEPNIIIYYLKTGHVVQVKRQVPVLRIPGLSWPVDTQFKFDPKNDCFRTNVFQGFRVYLTGHSYCSTMQSIKVIRWCGVVNLWVYLNQRNQIFLESRRGNRVIRMRRLTEECADYSTNVVFHQTLPIVFLYYQGQVIVYNYYSALPPTILEPEPDQLRALGQPAVQEDQKEEIQAQTHPEFHIYYSKGNLFTFKTHRSEQFYYAQKKTFSWLTQLKYCLKGKNFKKSPELIEIFKKSRANEDSSMKKLEPKLQKIKDLNKFMILKPEESNHVYPLLMNNDRIVEFDHINTRIRRTLFIQCSRLRPSQIILLSSKSHITVVYDIGTHTNHYSTGETNPALFSTWNVSNGQIEAVGPADTKFVPGIKKIERMALCQGLDSLFTIQSSPLGKFTRAGHTLHQVKLNQPQKKEIPKKVNVNNIVRENVVFRKLTSKKRRTKKEVKLEKLKTELRHHSKYKEYYLLNEWHLKTGEVKCIMAMPLEMKFDVQDPEIFFDGVNNFIYVKINKLIFSINRTNYVVQEAQIASYNPKFLKFPHKVQLSLDIKKSEMIVLSPVDKDYWECSIYALKTQMTEFRRKRRFRLATCSGFLILDQKRAIFTEKRVYSLDERPDAEEEEHRLEQYKQFLRETKRRSDPSNLFFKANKRGYVLSRTQEFIYGPSEVEEDGASYEKQNKLEVIHLFGEEHIKPEEAVRPNIMSTEYANKENSPFFVVNNSNDYYAFANKKSQLVIRDHKGHERKLDILKGISYIGDKVSTNEMDPKDFAAKLVMLSRLFPELADDFSIFSILMMKGMLNTLKENEHFFCDVIPEVFERGFKMLRDEHLIDMNYKRQFYHVFEHLKSVKK